MIKFFLCLTLIFYSSTLIAEVGSNVEIRAAAFFPSSNLFKKIYGNGRPSYQIEASSNNMYPYIDLWANLDWFSKKGKTDGLNDPTKVSVATTSLGLKFPYHFSNQLKPYIGIGASFSTIWLKNKTACGDEKLSKFSVGGIIKSGIYYFIRENVFIDIFIDYSYQPVHFKKHVDIGGIKAGLGLGVQFY